MVDKAFQTYRDIVIGLADGAIIVSAVIAGLYGAGQPAELIIHAGSVIAIGGALVFGYSRYASGLEAEKDFAGRDTSGETPDELIEKLELGSDFRQTAKAAIQQDRELWEKQVETPESAAPAARFLNPVFTGLAFLTAAGISTAAFFIDDAAVAFRQMLIAVSVLLLCCGFVKAKLAGRNTLTGALIQLCMGAMATGLCYLVGQLLG